MQTMTFIGRLDFYLAGNSCLAPTSFSRKRHFTVHCDRLRQSGPRPDTRLLRQPALEGLTRSARMDSPRQVCQKKFRRLEAAAAAALGAGGFREEGGGGHLLGLGLIV
ncbi:hypothetical protein F511_27305 [Dorcoceras hygrometricum]|uniref:Uncharacterized protein n=1 Tax=Dorcoceras hygrometricum TaxID=472368 RepID=A0A2Z7BIL1_9LAMI|nr:hypothetical protein F511_27305 [Dorcoceras hygrometricum]